MSGFNFDPPDDQPPRRRRLPPVRIPALRRGPPPRFEDTRDIPAGPRVLASSWAIQLQAKKDQDLKPDAIRTCQADCVIIDYSRDGSADGAFKPAEVAMMRERQDGAPKSLIAYMSIGEAEDHCFYWQKAWLKNGHRTAAAPAWLYQPNEGGWEGNFKVRFWDPDWQRIIVDDPSSYLNRIIDAGFDGVFLDIIEAAEFWASDLRGNERNPDADKAMIDFVVKIANHARVTRGKPGFLVVPNGDFLVESALYRANISAFMREDSIYESGPRSEAPRVTKRQRTGDNSIDEIGRRVKWAERDGIPVLAIEYLLDRKIDEGKIPDAQAELQRLGGNVLPYFSVRDLDRMCPEIRVASSVGAVAGALGAGAVSGTVAATGLAAAGEPDFSNLPDQDDDPEALEREKALSQEPRRDMPQVSWGPDERQPDYAHLLVAKGEGVIPPKTFSLTPDVLELVIRANHFDPKGPNDIIVFGLRGAVPARGTKFTNQAAIDIEETRPNHIDLRCTIGFYDRRKRLLSAFLGSTVPNKHYMEGYWRHMHGSGKTNANLLPTGCYIFRVNTHSKGRIKPALRLTNPANLKDDGNTVVLRTSKDLTFSHDDLWDFDKTEPPYDNIHCAYYMDQFSSAGCQTIQGKQDEPGPWAEFQKVLRTFAWDARIDYLLVTGRDAAIAAQIIARNNQGEDKIVGKCLGRLRHGSQGEAVAALQKNLGVTEAFGFGPQTRLALVKKERETTAVNSDGIYSPDDDTAFKWQVLPKQLPTATPVAGTANATPDGTATTTTATTPTSTVTAQSQLDPATLVLLPGGDGTTLSPDQKILVVPGQGRWVVGPQPGKITFEPEPGFTGSPNHVRYQISDIYGRSGTAWLTVNVQAARPPTLAPDTATTVAGAPVVIAVLANDTSLDGNIAPGSVRMAKKLGAQLTADGKVLTVDGQGTWVVLEDGKIRFSPLSTFAGQAMATYIASNDRNVSAEADITVTVAPPTPPPQPVDDVATGEAGKPVTVDVLGNDAGAPLPGPGTTGPAAPAPGPGAGPGPAPVASGGGDAKPGDGKPGSGQAGGQQKPPKDKPAGIISLTEEQLRRFAPHAKQKYVDVLVRDGDRILADNAININPLRLCHFLAQVGHESGGFTIERESLNYKTASLLVQNWPKRFPTVADAQPYLMNEAKLAEKVYGNRMGNTQEGDGLLYRGRGLIQLTGRECYREYGRELGLDLENNPELACEPEPALRIAVHNWMKEKRNGRSLNQLADDNNIKAITQAVNGGTIGLPQRQKMFDAAWKIWGTGGGAPVVTKTPNALSRGDRGEKVEKLQVLLVRAGYLPADEVIDGHFGPNTERTVMRFQKEHGLNINGIVDDATWAALEAAPVVQQPAGAGDRRGPIGGRVRGGPSAGTSRSLASRDLLFLLAVLFSVVAVAIIVLNSIAAGSVSLGGGWPRIALGALALALVALIAGVWHGARRRDPLDDLPVGNIASGSAVSRGGTTLDTAAAVEDNPRVLRPASNVHDFASTDAALRRMGFDDKYFEEREPVRVMPLLGEGADGEPGTPPPTPPAAHRPELPTENHLNHDVGGQPYAYAAAGVKPYPVTTSDVPFVIISMFGGDNNLSPQVANDMGEMAAGCARYGNVAVLALADTSDGPGRIIEIPPNGKMRVVEELGEIDTGDPETLARFLSRALVTYPGANKAIGFWDHGTGAVDEQDPNQVLLDRATSRRARDRTPARRLFIPRARREALNNDPDTRAMLHDNTGGVLTNLEAGKMLRASFGRAGLKTRVDMIYSDTCLNGMIEVLEELGDFATCVVASTDTEPPTGWDYEEWIRRTAYAIPKAPADWARHAVQAFGASYNGKTKYYPCTLAAYYADNDITECFAALVALCEEGDLDTFALLSHVRGRTQEYANRDIFDLVDFAANLVRVAETRSPKLAAAARQLLEACQRARIESVALGSAVTRSQGLAFWFPGSQHSLDQDIETYRRLQFSQKTHWAEYLNKMYHDSPLA